jgi:signal transduction histidine kinase
MQAMQDHLDGKAEVYEVEYRIRTSNGNYKWLRDIGAITERDTQNGTILVIGIVDDISQRKEAELALEAYSDQLEELIAERTCALEKAQKELIEKEKLATLGQLAGGVGHELRNPLGVINNALYILKATVAQENEKAQEYADMIGQQVQRSNKIISDLLNFAREPGANPTEIDLSALVARVLADFPPPDGVRVRKTVAKGQPKVLADTQHAEQILANLVSNAYQAMPEGGLMSISASRKQGEVRIAVRDSGTGISKENMDKLFTPLFTTKAKGIGLGLATSKKLAETNGGRIEVKSQEGKGSTFTLVLPAAGGEDGA